MIVQVSGGSVALRAREPSCQFRDFTIRTRSRYGYETEIDKLRKGFCDWYLYGWGDGIDTILEYILVDLDKVRNLELLEMQIWKIGRNTDGTEFIIIPVGILLDCECIVAYELTEQTLAMQPKKNKVVIK